MNTPRTTNDRFEKKSFFFVMGSSMLHSGWLSLFAFCPSSNFAFLSFQNLKLQLTVLRSFSLGVFFQFHFAGNVQPCFSKSPEVDVIKCDV